MKLHLDLQTDSKTKDNSKNSFSIIAFIPVIAVVIIIAILTYKNYNFYINMQNEKEMIEVNAVYSNQVK